MSVRDPAPLPLPALFVSHGAPSIVLESSPARAFLESLGPRLRRPAAILVVSAHWETPALRAESSLRPTTIHDYSGFPPEMERIKYPAPGHPELARRVADLLRSAGLDADVEPRGLDHGAWTPLSLMFPDATIPVVQLSLARRAPMERHLAAGRALAPLRRENVLVLGSGGATHNLRELGAGSRPPEWARAFEQWLVDAVENGDADALVDYRRRAPFADRNHPTPEHYTPLIVALGAAGAGARGRTLHRSFEFGSLAMTAFELA